MANKKVTPETRKCPICSTEFEVGGRGRLPRRTVYCSIRCVNLYRQSLNPHTGSHAPRPKKAKDTLHDEAWLRARYIKDGLPTTKIAELVGTSQGAVMSAMRKFGIPTRSKGEARRHREIGRVQKTVTKAELVAAYGGKCACCGETELTFLSLDHVNGGGRTHRTELGSNRKVYQLVKAEGFPPTYRILCMNCQFGTRFSNACPHMTL